MMLKLIKILGDFIGSFFSSPEFWGSIIASSTALFIAAGGAKLIKPIIGIKPKLELVALKRYRQVNQFSRNDSAGKKESANGEI